VLEGREGGGFLIAFTTGVNGSAGICDTGILDPFRKKGRLTTSFDEDTGEDESRTSPSMLFCMKDSSRAGFTINLSGGRPSSSGGFIDANQ
jgi:hypothetical protein